MAWFGRKVYATAGVMFYRDPATGELVPVTGTPTAGQVPRYDGSAVAWATASSLPAVPADADSVPYVLGILGGEPAWRVLTGTATLADGLLAPDGAVLLAPDGGALTPP